MIKYLISSVVLLFTFGCVVPNHKFEKIPPGIWRGVLLLDRAPFQKYGDDRDIVKKFDVDSELPFNFEVIYDNDSIFHIVIYNADERIKIDEITFGRDKATAKDTIIINFPVYDTQIRAIYEDGVMEGEWIVNYKVDYKIPFKAVHGVSDRFTTLKSEHINVQGKWNCTFEIDTDDEYKAVGVFNQKGDTLHGTFMTETGDYRYLEGKVLGNKIFMSVFDGAHAFLFLGKMIENGKLSGTFRSGSHYTTNWEGTRDNNASLINSFDLTKSVSSDPLDFSFENESGKTIGINDEKYKNKIKIVQIMGTWCPNCMDETIFLKDYFSKNKNDDISVFSIGFERYTDENKSKQSLKRYKERLNIGHEVLYGGYYDKEAASEKLPQLDKIISYPTMIITDRNNKIIKIHTGFSGPATPEYEQFKAEFTSIIDKIRNN